MRWCCAVLRCAALCCAALYCAGKSCLLGGANSAGRLHWVSFVSCMGLADVVECICREGTACWPSLSPQFAPTTHPVTATSLLSLSPPYFPAYRCRKPSQSLLKLYRA